MQKSQQQQQKNKQTNKQTKQNKTHTRNLNSWHTRNATIGHQNLINVQKHTDCYNIRNMYKILSCQISIERNLVANEIY